MGTLRTGNPPLDPNAETIYPRPGNRPYSEIRDDIARDGRISLAPNLDRRTLQVFAGGSSIETVCGLAAAVLAIVGITGFQQIYMLGSAAILIGLALLAQGGSIAARWNQLAQSLDNDGYDRSELVGGIGTEMFGGAVGVLLGILSLTHVMPFVLLPVAAITFGGSLLLGGAAQPDLEELVPDYDTRRARASRQAIQASGGVMVMVGIAAAVLGILALLEVGPVLTLTLVAMLAIGGSLLAAGGALTARFARRFA